MKPYSLLLAMALSYCCHANCLLSKVSLDSRTRNSQTIIDGQVTGQHCCWNAEKSAIYTVNTIQVNSILKGNVPSTVEIITPGGELDGRLLVVEPNAKMRIGAKGIFFLNNNSMALNYSGTLKQYEIYSLAQGFIESNQFNGKYNDPFDEYQNKTAIYNLIQKNTSISYREITPIPASAGNGVNGDPAISFYSPATISAGSQSVLTIDGWGFGSRTGMATVQFRDANSTSSNVFTTIPDSSYILSWSNTEIKVLVPGASANRQGGAGTGTINVITSNGASINSGSPLNITYNQFEYKKNKIALIDQNGLGGYTFTLNTDFNSNADAKANFVSALDQWKCKTGVNITMSTTTTNSTCSNQMDNMNVISFCTNSCPLPAGALGVTYSSYTLCANSPIIPDGIDMIFSPNAGFYFGTGTTPSNQYDFATVVLHELGHAFGQGHSSNGSEVMYPSIANGVMKRTLNESTDIASVNDVVTRSAAASYCGYLKHKIVATDCSNNALITPIATKFSTDKTTGCAPLTVNFTDQSTGSPTSWRWDINNDGTTDNINQNPSYTFTTAGTYNVKLVAINSSTKDSVIKNAIITVAPALSANVNVTQNVSCNGGNNGSLTVTPTGGNGSYTYTWNNNQTTQALSNMTAGTYSVIIKDGFQCSVNSTKTITQPQPLNLNVTTAPESGNNTYAATLNTTGGTAPYSYKLDNTTDVAGNTISNLAAGNYTVTVKDNNNCLQNKPFVVARTTGVNEAESNIENLDVYPNPAANNINFNLTLKEYKTVKVELIDLSGQTVFQDEYNDIKDKQASVDLTNLSNGTYILKFGLPEGNTFRKIIVSR